jgi:hypothetical protein
MHGTRGSKTAIRRYMCSTRRYGHACGERIVKAHDLEAQLIDWIADFQPQGQLLDLLLQTLKATDTQHSQPAGERRAALLDQLQRLQDLYVLSDLTKAQYVMRRQALEEEVQRLGPPADPAADRARDLLERFPRFWLEMGTTARSPPRRSRNDLAANARKRLYCKGSGAWRDRIRPRPVPSTGRVFGPVIRSNAVNSRCWSINLPYASAGSVNLAVPRDPRSTSSRCKARADTVAALDAR